MPPKSGAIEFCELKELSLQNKRYMWSNERRRPTLVWLNKVFCNQPWDLAFDACPLHALSSSHSDHCPLLRTNHAGHRHSTLFKFENFWTRLPNFQEMITQAWNAPTTHTETFHKLGHKLYQTSKALKYWANSLISDTRQKLRMHKRSSCSSMKCRTTVNFQT
jgi:hypothetical protein